mgnify:CR=1 FL=1
MPFICMYESSAIDCSGAPHRPYGMCADGQVELLVVSERTHRIEEPSDLRGRLRFDQPVLHDGPLPGSKAGHDREARPDAQNAEKPETTVRGARHPAS